MRKYFQKENKLFMDHKLKTPEKNYSLIKFILEKGNWRRALISAGIHGDEPSGINAICSFLENNQFNTFAEE